MTIELQLTESQIPINPELAQRFQDLVNRVNYYLQNPTEAKKVALQHDVDSASSANAVKTFLPTLKSEFPTCPTLARLIDIFASDSRNAIQAMSKATRWMRLAPSHSTFLGQPIDASVSAQQLSLGQNSTATSQIL